MKVLISTRAVVRWLERGCWTVGVAALALWAAFTWDGRMGAEHELRTFAAHRLEAGRPATLPIDQRLRSDQRLWSPKRMAAWRDTLEREAPVALAVLRIPRLDLEVAVLPGTDEWTLNRAVGHIEDTPRPGETGNSGIAGHRDGFFRVLKDVQVGDRLDLETLDRRLTFRVERTWIVKPEDVSVLDTTASPALTLVTCYPFYFVGSAPERFIVRAVRAD
jgi:sortase A